SLGMALPPALDDELVRIRHELAEDTSHHAFIVGDVCPDNNRVDGDEVKLFDFEFSGWHHAALEASACVVPFCSCWCVARLPDGVTELVYDAYCETSPAGRDDRSRELVVRAGAAFVLATIARWTDAFGEDEPVGPPDRAPAHVRQYVADRLDWLA